MKKIIFCLLIIGLSLIFSGSFTSAEMSSTNYTIYADVFSIGGIETSQSTNYKIQDTLGEAIIWSATSTSANYGVKAGFRDMYPDQYLTLSVSDTSIDLGTLSEDEAQSASHTMIIDTNAFHGFAVTVSGSTLTSGVNTIDGIGATAASSTPGIEQFGINLVNNATPNIGADPAGTAPIGSVAGQYGTADKFTLNSGDTIASASSDINQTTYTISYIANIAASTEAGTYTTTLTYAATANF